MIEHVYRRAAACPLVSRVIVATDDLRIATAVAGFGGNVRLTRADHRTGTDRLAEVAAALDCDIIVNFQGDEPLLDSRAIAEAVTPFTDASVQITTLYRRIDNPSELSDPKHIGLYAYRRSALLVVAALDQTPLERAESLEQLRALEHGIRIKAVETAYDSIGVDTPEDLEQVRRLFAAPTSG